MSDRPDFLPAVEAIDAVPDTALAATALHLAAMMARVAVRMAGGVSSNGSSDRMLSITEAAARTGMSKSWLYRHNPTLPFARKIGRKVVFSEQGLTRWLARRR